MLLKDFTKLETFLMIVKEKSFSKASAKLGISQPAVTQQIKFIEDYLNTKIIERKKNGIVLTKNGEKLYAIALKLDKFLINTESEIMKIINKDVIFGIGASFSIGNYILPRYMDNIKESINNNVFIKIANSDIILDELEEKKIDLALIESPIFRDNLIYREWLKDELVVFSNTPIPKSINKNNLSKYKWVSREWGSHTKKIISELFENMGIECNEFDVQTTVSSSTAVKQTILKNPINEKQPTLAILSRCVIEDEVQQGKLFESRIQGHKLSRKFYIVYLKDRKNDPFIERVINYLLSIKSI